MSKGTGSPRHDLAHGRSLRFQWDTGGINDALGNPDPGSHLIGDLAPQPDSPTATKVIGGFRNAERALWIHSLNRDAIKLPVDAEEDAAHGVIKDRFPEVGIQAWQLRPGVAVAACIRVPAVVFIGQEAESHSIEALRGEAGQGFVDEECAQQLKRGRSECGVAGRVGREVGSQADALAVGVGRPSGRQAGSGGARFPRPKRMPSTGRHIM